MAKSLKRKLHLGIVCHPTYGGSGVVASELGMALADRGHEVHIFSYLRPFRIPASHPRTYFHEVEVTSYPLFKYPPYTQALATKLAVICKEQPIDILHAHYAIPHSISTYLCQQMLGPKAPRAVTTLHGTDITLVGLDKSFFEITRFGILQSNGVTAVSENLALETQRRFQIDREIKVIPNFVDTEDFHPSRRDAGFRGRLVRNGEALIGHISNFRAVKRILDVVRVFHKVSQKMPGKLLLIGDGPEREPARNLIAELGLTAKVKFLGLHRQVPGLLAQLDLFLLPSEYESFGLSALEAMSCGVPVIATEVGGLPEVVVDGKTGFLYPVGDIDAMAKGAIRLLTSDGLRDRFAKASRRRAVDCFPRGRIVCDYEDYYCKVLDGG